MGTIKTFEQPKNRGKMHIFIGSTNPVKVNAVKQAVEDHWPGAKFVSFKIASGVAAQPLSDEETRIGAENRARAALRQGLEKISLSSDLAIGVGLEGGVFQSKGELWSTVWAAVVDQAGAVYTANGARFKVPARIAKHVKVGGEMGPAVERLVGEADVRSKQGMIGVITKNFTHRTEEYTTITKLAIGLWYGRDWDHKLSQS